MRSRILFLPECPDRDAFVDVLARASFHLAYLEPETLTFVVAPGLHQSAERVVEDTIVPDGFDARGEAGEQAAQKAKDSFLDMGKRVAIRRPPPGCDDWNDALPKWSERPVEDWEF